MTLACAWAGHKETVWGAAHVYTYMYNNTCMPHLCDGVRSKCRCVYTYLHERGAAVMIRIRLTLCPGSNPGNGAFSVLLFFSLKRLINCAWRHCCGLGAR